MLLEHLGEATAEGGALGPSQVPAAPQAPHGKAEALLAILTTLAVRGLCQALTVSTWLQDSRQPTPTALPSEPRL